LSPISDDSPAHLKAPGVETGFAGRKSAREKQFFDTIEKRISFLSGVPVGDQKLAESAI